MPYVPIFILLLMIVINVIFRFASLFRLAVPVLYAIIVPVFFPDWLHANETIVNVIWFVLVGLVILSWFVTIRKRIMHKRQTHQSKTAHNSYDIAGDAISTSSRVQRGRPF